MSGRKPKVPPIPATGEGTKVPPGAYPVFSSAVAMQLMRTLRDPQVAACAARIISERAEELRSEVLSYIDKVEEAVRVFDPVAIYEQAHEIRGLAGNAGLLATGRIANGLCRYLDALAVAGHKPEQGVVALHLDAISRAAHAEDEATRLGDAVANELAELVERKLAEINEA